MHYYKSVLITVLDHRKKLEIKNVKFKMTFGKIFRKIILFLEKFYHFCKNCNIF